MRFPGMPVSVRCSISSSSRRRSTTSVSRISSYIRFHQIGEICDLFSPEECQTTSPQEATARDRCCSTSPLGAQASLAIGSRLLAKQGDWYAQILENPRSMQHELGV